MIISDFWYNGQLQHCTVILYRKHKGSTLKEVKEDMMFTAGEDLLHIKHGEKVGCRAGMWQGESGICLGRPVTITTQETIAKVLAASLLKEEYKALYCREVTGHWVPKLLGSGQKWIQHSLWRENGSLSVLWQFVTKDETLVHHFQPEMKSERWKGSLPYKKSKTVMSAGKVMVYTL